MKKTNCKAISSLIIASAAFIFASCASTKSLTPDYSPMAMVSIYSNTNIYLYDEEKHRDFKDEDKSEEDGVLTGIVNKALFKDNPETLTVNERGAYAAKAFTSAMEAKGITVFTPETNSDAPCYSDEYSSFYDILRNTKGAEGYKVIIENKKELDKAVAQKTGANSMCYVYFKFYKEINKEGFTEVSISPRVLVRLFIADKDGKVVYSTEKSWLSNDSTYYHHNKYDREALVSLFPALIDKACKELASEIFPDSNMNTVSTSKVSETQEEETYNDVVVIPRK